MLTDAHCHPFDLALALRNTGHNHIHPYVIAAASACTLEEFLYNENAHNTSADNGLSLLPCFGIHPQFPAVKNACGGMVTETNLNDGITTLHDLAASGRLAAAGECGFDLYNDTFKETEPMQDLLFAAHLEIAVRFNLPVVVHVRRAMHKIFAAAKTLAKCKAVVFHSWPGTLEEANSLLRRGVNAYFSFGSIITLNHKQAMRSCAYLPVERLLTETDAPFQPRRAEKFSQFADLPFILEAASSLRRKAGNSIASGELETIIEANFRSVFNF